MGKKKYLPFRLVFCAKLPTDVIVAPGQTVDAAAACLFSTSRLAIVASVDRARRAASAVTELPILHRLSTGGRVRNFVGCRCYSRNGCLPMARRSCLPHFRNEHQKLTHSPPNASSSSSRLSDPEWYSPLPRSLKHEGTSARPPKLAAGPAAGSPGRSPGHYAGNSCAGGKYQSPGRAQRCTVDLPFLFVPTFPSHVHAREI